MVRFILGKVFNKKVQLNILTAIPFWTTALFGGLMPVSYIKLIT
jgi:lipid-A-disaccharide synthase-like uncharacterized protein